MPYTSVRRAIGVTAALSITATLADQVELLADALQHLRDAGVNMVQATGAGIDGTAYFYCVPEQVEAVKQMAASVGINIRDLPALVFEGEDQPGAIVDVARKIGAAGINIEYFSAAAVEGKYCAVFFFSADDFDRAAVLFDA